MDRERTLQLLKGGYDSVQRWNRWRQNHSKIPNLQHTDFRNCDLTDADLSNMNLEKCNFYRVRLVGGLLENANLSDADLRFANFDHTGLVNVRFVRVNFKGTNFCGADLRRATFKDVNFNQAECDVHTKWPDGFAPETVGLNP